MDIKQWGWMLMRRFLRAQMIHNQFNRQPPGLQDDSLLWNACFMSFSLSAASLRGLNCQGEAGQLEIPPSFSVSAPLKPDGRPPPRRRLTRSGARFFLKFHLFLVCVCREPWALERRSRITGYHEDKPAGSALPAAEWVVKDFYF